MPLISIVVPCYNVEKYIDRCIQSIVSQTIGIENIEVILVNDASTDGTYIKLCEWKEKFPQNIIVISYDKNIRQGGARNRGIKAATSSYIGFVDSDDWIEPNMYEILYNAITSHQCDMAGCMFIRDDGNAVIEKDDKIPINIFRFNDSQAPFWWDIENDSNTELPLNCHWGGIYTGLYHRELIFDYDVWFPEGVTYEDNYWINTLMLNCKSMVRISAVLYHYFVNYNSTILKKDSYHHLDRLNLEVMLLEEYKKRGAFTKYYVPIMEAFFERYYINTYYIFFERFRECPDMYKEIRDTVYEYFPDWEKFLDVKNNLFLKTLAEREYIKPEELKVIFAKEYDLKSWLRNKKICFIACVDDDRYWNECISYLSELYVPEGYEVDVIEVRDAKSMCSGYNEGMKSSDASYKIYLQQDVFIIDRYFLFEMLDIFDASDEIGMIGLVGSTYIPQDAVVWHGPRISSIYSEANNNLTVLNDQKEVSLKDLVIVKAVDGLLIATCDDIEWREDIFNGWYYYDLSQSQEFIKKGYKVVVPDLERPIAVHKNNESMDSLDFNQSRKIFIDNYMHCDRKD